MTDIEKGSRVRVRADAAVVIQESGPGWCAIAQPTGPMVRVPTEWVEVISPPLPPEPPVGEYVEVEPGDGTTSVWRRFVVGWQCLTEAGIGPMTWADLHQHGDGTVLVRESRVSRYRQAISDGRVIWLHQCGHQTHIPVARCRPGIDPNAPPPEIAAHITASCADTCPDPEARWVPLAPALRTERSDG